MQHGFARIRMGTSNMWIIKGARGYILVDAGYSGCEHLFSRKMRTLDIRPDQVDLIVITHAHHDHAGSLAALKQLCQCPVAVHAGEAHLLREGHPSMSPGTNLLSSAIATRVMRVMETGRFRFPPTEPDILIRRDIPLAEYGVDGVVIPTPGHTPGSLSILLADGNAFVGDLVMRFPPLSFTPLPPFADNKADVYASWRLLLQRGAHTFWTGHGLACRAQQLRAALSAGDRKQN